MKDESSQQNSGLALNGSPCYTSTGCRKSIQHEASQSDLVRSLLEPATAAGGLLPRLFHQQGSDFSIAIMAAVQLLDRPIAFHRCLVQLTQSVTGALLLSQAIYWHNRAGKEWWYKTAEEWQDETGMGRYEFEQARKACSAFLDTKKEGMPCKTFYRLNVSQLAEGLQASLQKVCKQDCTPSANKIAEGLQSTTTETSSETSSETFLSGFGVTPCNGAITRDEVEQLYKLYPRRQAKGEAIKAIKKAVNLAPFTLLMERTKAFAEAVSRWPAGNDQFIPLAATWFNQQRWEDDPKTWERIAPSNGNPILAMQQTENEIRRLESSMGGLETGPERTRLFNQVQALRSKLQQLSATATP